MNDTLSYMQASPQERKIQYHKLTFSMMYFYNEHYSKVPERAFHVYNPDSSVDHIQKKKG